MIFYVWSKGFCYWYLLKPGVVNLCTSITELKKIDLNEIVNFLKAKEFKLGFGANECSKNLKKSNLPSNQNLQTSMNESIIFVTDIPPK